MAEPGGDCTGYSLTNLPPAAKLCILFAVDKAGNRLRTVFPGDFAEQNQTYDTAGNLVTITATGQAGGSATTFYSYTYSNLISSVHTGHISSRTDSAGNHDDYVYTNEGRLSTVTTKASGGTITGYRLYCYDANGNRTSTSTTNGATCPGGTTYTYDGANQQLGTGTAFDLSGDETSMTTALPAPATSRVSTWTESQQLATTALNGGTALANTYYDAGNSDLILTDTGSGNQDELRNAPLGVGRVSNAGGNVHPERDPSGTILGYRTGTGVHYYPMTDNLGSILVVTDSTGNAADTYSYDPFGVQTTTINTYPQPFGYTGAYTNTGTGLVHLGARYYDPTQGRFTQPDPSGQESNAYAYAGDDPVNNLDPSGSSFLSVLEQIDTVVETIGIPISFGVIAIEAGATVGALGIGLIAGIPLILAGISLGVLYALYGVP
jgi:RHS repeat-associated protein